MTRERDEARLTTVAAAQRTQQERDALAEVEGENEGLRMRLQAMEEEIAVLAGEADQVRGELGWSDAVYTFMMVWGNSSIEWRVEGRGRKWACCPFLVRGFAPTMLRLSSWYGGFPALSRGRIGKCSIDLAVAVPYSAPPYDLVLGRTREFFREICV